MSKTVMERIKVLVGELDAAETAVLTGWLIRRIKMDVPHGDGCPHYDKPAKDCRFPDVVE